MSKSGRSVKAEHGRELGAAAAVPTDMGYAAVSMRGLVACPFCREMYEPGEADRCPLCGVDLLNVEKLPKRKDAEHDEARAPLSPDEETLPWTFLGRGRGALLATSLAGLVGFVLPWVHQVLPERATLTGPELAHRLGWMWAPAVAWLVMIPLVASRRSIYRMRGARVAVAFLAAMSLITVVVRVATVPHGTAIMPVSVTWGLGVYVTAAASVAGLALAYVFGGRIDDLATQHQHHRRGDETLH
jgi:hypothetical protein